MQKTIIIAAALAACSAQANIAYVGGTLTENFNGIPVVDSDSRVTLAGTGAVGTQVAIPGLTGWTAARIGGSGSSDIAIWDDSSTGGGRFYAYGIGSDRSLGSLASGTTVGGFGASFVNNSVQTLGEVTISYTRQIWHIQGTSNATAKYENRLLFAYGTSAGGVSDSDYLTSASMSDYPALDAISPEELTVNSTNSGTDPDRRVDGTLPQNSELVSSTISGLSWAPGDVLYIRWSDFNQSGFDAGMSVENFSMVAAVPEPSTVALSMGLIVLAGVMIRRRHR